MDKIDRDTFSSSGVTIGKCNVRRLLFADNLALFSSNKSDLQYALDGFSDECLNVGMKISKAKTEIMCLSRHPVQCSFQTNGATPQKTEKFKKVSAVMRQLYRSVVQKRELCAKAKLFVFRSVFVL